MKIWAFVFLTFFLFFNTQNASSDISVPVFFKISAGHKILKFEKNTEVQWSDFCIDNPMGCARFQINKKGEIPTFGFIKVINDKALKNKFFNYCQDVFNLGKKTKASFKNFKTNSKKALLECQWKDEEDYVYFFWRDEIILSATISGKWDVEKMVSEAILNEKN